MGTRGNLKKGYRLGRGRSEKGGSGRKNGAQRNPATSKRGLPGKKKQKNRKILPERGRDKRGGKYGEDSHSVKTSERGG